MARERTEYEGSVSRIPEEQWRWRSPVARREERRGGPSGWLLAGLIAVGVVGGLAWYYLGPDLRRYLKIRNM